MVSELAESAAEALWPTLLELRRFFGTDAALEASRVAFARRGGEWSLLTSGEQIDRAIEAGEAELTLPLNEAQAESAVRGGEFSYEQFLAGGQPLRVGEKPLELELQTFFRAYLPMLVGGLRARRRGELFVTAHVAQSLDGRIACVNGQSQWISNQANLVHAHRIRALHDGVLVGRGTVTSDDPALNVRHVAGDDPRRVILSASARLLDEDAGRFQVFRDSGCLLISGRSQLAEGQRLGAIESLADTVDVVAVELEPDGSVSVAKLTAALTERGIHSIFIEGGSLTISNFFQRSAIDLLHVHVAPVILGSGISGFTLPEVKNVQLARRVITEHFSLDGELLVECREIRSADGRSESLGAELS